MPSAPVPPYWYVLKVTSNPWDDGTAVAYDTPPSWLSEAAVRRSVPLPGESSGVEAHPGTGDCDVEPDAVRHATLLPVVLDGSPGFTQLEGICT